MGFEFDLDQTPPNSEVYGEWRFSPERLYEKASRSEVPSGFRLSGLRPVFRCVRKGKYSNQLVVRQVVRRVKGFDPRLVWDWRVGRGSVTGRPRYEKALVTPVDAPARYNDGWRVAENALPRGPFLRNAYGGFSGSAVDLIARANGGFVPMELAIPMKGTYRVLARGYEETRDAACAAALVAADGWVDKYSAPRREDAPRT